MARDAVVIIATRPESKRLPNKVFRKIVGIPAIEHLLNRLNRCELPIVLAVPYFCEQYDYLKNKYPDQNILIYKGNPESPLHRMADALSFLDLDQKWIVRITHDDILIDNGTMLALVDECASTPGCGYGYSPAIVEGAGVEVIHRENLIYAARERREWTEFISYFVKEKPFSRHVVYQPRKSVCRNYRLTMDYLEDAVILETILREVGPDAELDVICEFLDRHPYILKINALPKVSIYTCAYNAEAYIERTMESILSHHQNGEFEYIFVDDASTDSTLLRASKYGHDKRVKYIVNPVNQGLASSSNTALTNSRGQYVMRVDADDLLLPYAISTTMEIMDKEGVSIVYPAYKEINEKEEIISPVRDATEHHHAGCALMDKRMINEIRFTEGLKHWDSKDLYNRIKAKFRRAYTEEPLWYYRRHSKSLSANNTIERMRAYSGLMNNA